MTALIRTAPAAEVSGTGKADLQSSTVRLLIQCDDRPGIVAAVSRFLAEAGANIMASAQHSADAKGARRFYMRIEFEPGTRNLETLRPDFQHAVAGHFDMDW